MHETEQDIEELGALIEYSNAKAGPFLRSSFEIPENSLNARQLIRRLDRTETIALGTVTRDGRPRVAPVVAIFFKGSFCIPTVRSALRAKHILHTPALSLSLYEGIDFSVIVHGMGEFIPPDDPAFDELVALQRADNAGDVRVWGHDPVFIRAQADLLYSFARFPEQFPE